MKRFISLFVFLFALSITSTFAQNKGDMNIGGKLTFELTSVSPIGSGVNATACAFAVEPEFNYFVADNFRVGVALGYGYAESIHMLSLMPNIAYYVRLADKFYYTPQFSLGGGIIALDGGAYGVFAMSLSAFALEYKPTNHFAVAMDLVSLDFNILENTSTFRLDLLNSPTVGFKYYF